MLDKLAPLLGSQAALSLAALILFCLSQRREPRLWPAGLLAVILLALPIFFLAAIFKVLSSAKEPSHAPWWILIPGNAAAYGYFIYYWFPRWLEDQRREQIHDRILAIYLSKIPNWRFWEWGVLEILKIPKSWKDKLRSGRK